jgi:hypothetical protein
MGIISSLKGSVALVGTFALVILSGPLFPQAQNPKGLTREQVAAIHAKIGVLSEEANAIPAALAKATGDVYIHAPGMVVDKVTVPPKDEMATWVRQCDMIARGRMGSGSSYLTARKGFLNTDWNFTLEEVLKNNPMTPVSPGSTITVIAFGGKLKIGQRTVYALQHIYREFRTGEQYLLFLKLVPETGAYSRCGPTGFLFSGLRTVPLRLQTGYIHPGIDAMDKETLLREVKAAVAGVSN